MIDEMLQRPVGTNQHSEGVDNINKLERPDILERIKQGEFRSVRATAIEVTEEKMTQ